MAFTLSPSSKTAVDFEGPTAALVTIPITPDPGSSLRQTAATYNGTTIGGATPTFKLAKGVTKLAVSFGAEKLNGHGDLAETCAAGSVNPLRGIRSNAIFRRLYFVEGLCLCDANSA